MHADALLNPRQVFGRQIDPPVTPTAEVILLYGDQEDELTLDLNLSVLEMKESLVPRTGITASNMKLMLNVSELWVLELCSDDKKIYQFVTICDGDRFIIMSKEASSSCGSNPPDPLVGYSRGMSLVYEMAAPVADSGNVQPVFSPYMAALAAKAARTRQGGDHAK